MSRLSEMFEKLKEKRAALITYATAFYPDEEESFRIILTMLESGADAVEIGIPFSDPVLDGRIIQQTSAIALENGATVRKVLDLSARTRERTDKPLLLMSYSNPIHRYGVEIFARDARFCGIDGVLVPDLPVEEIKPWSRALSAEGIDIVTFCSVNTTRERVEKVCALSTGFIYCMSLLGTTGVREELSNEVFPLVRKVRFFSDKPVVVGIGISTPEQCGAVGTVADGVVVGSALMKTIMEGGDYLESVGSKVKQMSEALSFR